MVNLWTPISLSVWTLLLVAVSATEVTIKLYPMSKSGWSSSHNTTLVDAIAAQANAYCWSTLSDCNLAANITFDAFDVGVANLQDSSKSMSMGVTLYYPSGASLVDNSLTSVPSSALEAIIGIARDTYHSETGVYVTYVGAEYYGVPPDGTANKAIIPVAFLVVIAVAVVTVALAKWQSNKERAETLKARQERKRAKEALDGTGANRTNPLETTTTTTVASAATTPRANHGVTTPRTNPNNQVSPDNYDTAAPTVMMNYGNFSVNEFREDKLVKNGLSPLHETTHALDGEKDAKAEEDEEARKERKRRRKERKREKERLRQQQMEDSLEMYDNQGLDSSTLTESEQAKIPTFKVVTGGAA